MKRLAVFTGERQPEWRPEVDIKVDAVGKLKTYLEPKGLPAEYKEFYYLADGFLDRQSCSALISAFSLRPSEPVGVSGYSSVNDGEIGSFRANAWAEKLAQKVSVGLKSALSVEEILNPIPSMNEQIFLNSARERLRLPIDRQVHSLLGATPFMRFMKYPSGGRHVPHYDAPYRNSDLRYITLMSWVLYLNTPPGSGGEFQFIDDGQWHLPPAIKAKEDWKIMANEREILKSIAPQEGRLLVFPHWLPHQVSLYSGPPNSWRYIVRGDVAYGF